MFSSTKVLARQLGVILDKRLTVATALDRVCDTHPDQFAFNLDQELPYRELSGPRITCRQLRSFANRVSNILLDAGLKRYDRVAVCKTNGPDYFFLALAIIRAGGISVPINSGMDLESLQYYLNYTGAKFLITDAALFASKIKDPARLPMVERWIFPDAPADFAAPHCDLNALLETVSEDFAPVKLSRDSDVIIAHTSGTTGYPKGVIATSGTLLRSARCQYTLGPVTGKNRTAIAAPFNHLVTHTGMLSAMLAGLNVWPVARTEPHAVMELIERERITIFFAFPDVYSRMYLEGLDDYDFSSMRTWVGTADTSHSIHKKAFTQKGAFLRLFGKTVLRSIFVDAFGSSEICFAALTRISFSFSKPRLDRLLGTTNPAGPRVRIADEDGRTVPRGRIGRVMVKGPTLFKSYWNSHDRLHGTMYDGWWWTGDIGYRDRLGRFYHLDRATDVIQTTQGPVYSLLAEEVLMNHPEVSEVSVFGVPSADGKQAAIAVVNARTGCAPNPLSLRLWTNERLKLSAAITEVFVVQPDEVPRGLTGKVLKRVLRTQYATQVAQRSTNAESVPATSTATGCVAIAIG